MDNNNFIKKEKGKSLYTKSIQENQEYQRTSCYYNLENKSDLPNSLKESWEHEQWPNPEEISGKRI
jgi:hypothetical protein